MHVKHYTTTLLLNTSKPRMFIAYWMPCTSARPAGPRNPNRSPLSVRDSASHSLFLSVIVLCLKPIDPSFAASTEMTSVLSLRVQPSTISHVDAIDRSRRTRCKLFRNTQLASIARQNIYVLWTLGHFAI